MSEVKDNKCCVCGGPCSPEDKGICWWCEFGEPSIGIDECEDTNLPEVCRTCSCEGVEEICDICERE